MARIILGRDAGGVCTQGCDAAAGEFLTTSPGGHSDQRANAACGDSADRIADCRCAGLYPGADGLSLCPRAAGADGRSLSPRAAGANGPHRAASGRLAVCAVHQ